ncbi:glycoside hydrolase family 81 protein [Planoprotostelium fungivorum]|uniref:glucan endo-1,3-beta-D-glucosidase n=1 Tax=Planoprotostelium fungivorum TaxID=1890364 RepID=A0A2P6NNA2_9EUKA|nr:glycoside hydrolase family 81 protein [Planoprotostelium fungivorum]
MARTPQVSSNHFVLVRSRRLYYRVKMETIAHTSIVVACCLINERGPQGRPQIWFRSTFVRRLGSSWEPQTPNHWHLFIPYSTPEDITASLETNAMQRVLLFMFLLVQVSCLLNDPISTTPSRLPQTAQMKNPPNSLFQGLTAPYPTNQWWSASGTGDGTFPAAGPYPYQYKKQSQSINIGVGENRQITDGTTLRMYLNTDLAIGATEFAASTPTQKAVYWDELSVHIQYTSGQAAMTAVLVQGNPYFTLRYESATVKVFFDTIRLFDTINGQTLTFNDAIYSGSSFTLTNNAGNTWLIYVLGGTSISFSATREHLYATSPFTGVIRFAFYNQSVPSQKNTYDTYSGTFPTGVTFSRTVSNDVATINYNFKTEGDGKTPLLMMTFPHHRDVMTAPAVDGTIQILTTKGYMKSVVGNSWSFRYDLPTVQWNAPRPIETSCVNTLIGYLQSEINSAVSPVSQDFYAWGVEASKFARLALMADQVGRQDLVQQIITKLRNSFAPWYDPSTCPPGANCAVPAYDVMWGGIVSNKTLNDPGLEFGNGFYADHHFHYGYWIYAYATLIKYDPSFRKDHDFLAQELIRDFANPSKVDPYFPPARHFDHFHGHSWASGIAFGGSDRNQESTSEAVNSYYALSLYALVVQNDDLYQWARILMAQEIKTAQRYWHLYDSNSDPHPQDPSYPRESSYNVTENFSTFANLASGAGSSAGAWTFFGNNPTYISGIELIPITPVSELLVDVPWAKRSFSACQADLKNVGQEWETLLQLARSTFDPAGAWGRLQQLNFYGNGGSASNSLYFAATRPTTPAGMCGPIPTSTQAPSTVPAPSTTRQISSTVTTRSVAPTTSTAAASTVTSQAPAPSTTTSSFSNSNHVASSLTNGVPTEATQTSNSAREQTHTTAVLPSSAGRTSASVLGWPSTEANTNASLSSGSSTTLVSFTSLLLLVLLSVS